MRCIFCKAESSKSTSVEHIVQHSLGNQDHTLPIGVVCDCCNNYLGCKIEKPVLDSGIFRLLRMDRCVPNKRGRLPTFLAHEPANLPDYRLMSRFLGKVGLEALASRVIHVPGWNEELVDKPELDALRTYVRFDRAMRTWPFAYRALYPVNAIFQQGETHFDILHEYDLFCTEGSELYAVIALFGVEFAINLGGPDLDGYRKWLEEHDCESPLYRSKA